MKRLIVFAMIVPMLLMAFYMPSAAAQAPLETELVIISPHLKGILDSYKAAFEKYCADVLGQSVTFTYSYQSTENCYTQVKEWAGRPRADIWWGGGVTPFQTAASDGLFLAYKTKDWSVIPSAVSGIPAKDQNGYWTGYALSGFGFAIHTDYLKKYNLPEPKSFADLTNPVYRGHIVMCTPKRSGSTHTMLEGVLQGMGADPGWAYLRKMAANVAVFTSRSGDVINDVNKGEHGIGLVVDYYGFESAVAGLPIKLVYPNDYPVANADSIAILTGAPHPGIAKAFIDYVLSQEGQKLSMGIEQRGVKCPNPRLPIRTDVTIPANLPDVLKLKMVSYNTTLEASRRRNVDDTYEATIEKKHAELKDAAKAIETAQTTLQKLKEQGYDMTQALAGLNSADTLFGKGDYAGANTAANAAAGLAVAPPPYTTYAAIVAVFVVLVLATLYYKRRKAK